VLQEKVRDTEESRDYFDETKGTRSFLFTGANSNVLTMKCKAGWIPDFSSMKAVGGGRGAQEV